MFLSFALLSSTGIGDIIPIKAPARALASVEMLVGVMYLAAVVSRLIGLTVQRAEPHAGAKRSRVISDGAPSRNGGPQ